MAFRRVTLSRVSSTLAGLALISMTTKSDDKTAIDSKASASDGVGLADEVRESAKAEGYHSQCCQRKYGRLGDGRQREVIECL